MDSRGPLTDTDVRALVVARDAFTFAVTRSIDTDTFVPELAYFERFEAGPERDEMLALYAAGRKLLVTHRVRCVCGTDPFRLLDEHVPGAPRGDGDGAILGYRLERDGVDALGRAVFALFLVRARQPRASSPLAS